MNHPGIEGVKGRIEISGRQTGKTTRLANWASLAGILWPVTVVIGESWEPEEFRRQFKVTGSRVSIITENDLPQDEREYREGLWCFDEFDWFTHPVPVIKNGYYCTTPRFLRVPDASPESDPLLQLIQIHRGYQCVPMQACPWLDMGKIVTEYTTSELDLISGQVFGQKVCRR